MTQVFLTRFFSYKRTARIRNQLTNFKQKPNESLSDAWERFRDLEFACPHHGLPDWLFIQTFYDGLTENARTSVDAYAGGALMDKEAQQAIDLVDAMARNQHWTSGRDQARGGLYEVNEITSLNAKLDAMQVAIDKLSSGQSIAQQVKSCGACGGDHSSVNCPLAKQDHEVETEEVNSLNNIPSYFSKPPFTQSYESKNWNNNSYKNNNNGYHNRNFQPKQNFNNNFRNTTFDNGDPPRRSFIPEEVQRFMHEQGKINKLMFEHLTKLQSGLDSLTKFSKIVENQVAQQATSLPRPLGQLPSQHEVNPRQEIKAINLRSGMSYEGSKLPDWYEGAACDEKEARCTTDQAADTSEPESKLPSNSQPIEDQEQPRKETEPADKGISNTSESKRKPRSSVPFPQRMAKEKLDKQFNKFIEIMELHITIPFTDAIDQIPIYAKFLKEILPKKRSLNDCTIVAMTEHCSAIIQSEMPSKMEDPEKFSIPCTIGKACIKKALCDLGASVSLMSRSIYERIGVGELKPTRMTFQLADSTIRLPLGVVEDVPVKVGKFFILSDFVVLEMEEDKEVPIILGRSFLKTARALIYLSDDILILRISGETIAYKIDEAMRGPSHVFAAETLEDFAEEEEIKQLSLGEEYDENLKIFQELLCEAKEVIGYSTSEDAITNNSLSQNQEDSSPCTDLEPEQKPLSPSSAVELEDHNRNLSPLNHDIAESEVPKVELKPLPEDFKYAFLEAGDTYPVIINAHLNPGQAKALLAILRKHRKAIGYSIDDLKGIHPSVCMHRILLEEGSKPVIEAQ